eukprot:14308980-Heterocapsa_arctica.AAC.1
MSVSQDRKHLPCHYVDEPGGCLRGDACPYSHAAQSKSGGKGSGKTKKGTGALAVAFLSVARPAQLPSALASPATTTTPPIKRLACQAKDEVFFQGLLGRF